MLCTPPGHFHLIAASVPCAQYSLAKTTATREFYQADALVNRVLEIVDFFETKSLVDRKYPHRFIENAPHDDGISLCRY